MDILDSPASTRLPYEVLRIIIILAYAYIPQPQEPDEPELDLQLVSPPVVASHVCRSWRYGLLYDPSLWTCILVPQFKPSGVMEILHRSGSASLNVLLVLRLDYSSKPYIYDGIPQMLFSLFQQMHRFKLLHIQINLMGYRSSPQHADSLHSSTEKLLSYLKQPAPKLQTFRFWCKENSFTLDNTFSNTLFSREAPNVKHIHYQPCPDFREIESPLFHNLSELYLTLPGENIELDHLLRLVELSPELKLLRVYSDWEEKAVIVHQPDSFRKINLLHLERLVLEANSTTELADFILGCIVFPPYLVWHITLDSGCLTDDIQLEDSPHLVEFLSRTPFSSLHIQFGSDGFVSLTIEEENYGPHHLDRNRLFFVYGSLDEFSILWDTAISYIGLSSRITHLDLVIKTNLELTIFPKIFRRMQDLESLTIRERIQIHSNVDGSGLPYLSILTLNPQSVATLEYNVNAGVTGPPDLDLVSISEDSPSSSPSSDSSAPITAILCPLLRELTVELDNPLDKAHAFILRACSDSRRREDIDVYSLHILVNCPGMEEGVESILGMGGNDGIHVSVVSH